MLPRLIAAAVLAFAQFFNAAGAQSLVDANLQNLLTALTTGAETTLVTPLLNGMQQVTSFQPSTRLSAADATAAIMRAREQLRLYGEPQPTAEEIARMLAGGPIELPGGRIQVPGILTASGYPAAIRSQLVAAGTPVPYSSIGPSSAAGGSAPAAPVAAREMALQQLAALGILNPSEDQIRTAMFGGTITTLNGVYQLPGIPLK